MTSAKARGSWGGGGGGGGVNDSSQWHTDAVKGSYMYSVYCTPRLSAPICTVYTCTRIFHTACTSYQGVEWYRYSSSFCWSKMKGF